MILPLALILCFMLGCQRGEEVVEEPVVDVEADVQAIKSLIYEWYKAYYVGDVDKLVSLYTEDAIRMGHDEPTLVGKEAIQATFKREMEQYDMQVDDDVEIDDRAEEVRVSGDLGMARGVDITITPSEGAEPIKSIVRWVAIYERQADGTWEIVCEIWNNYIQLTTSQEKEQQD